MCCILMKFSVIRATLEEAHFEVFTNLWLNNSAITNTTVYLETECAIRCLKHSSCDLATVGYMENQTRKQCLIRPPSNMHQTLFQDRIGRFWQQIRAH